MTEDTVNVPREWLEKLLANDRLFLFERDEIRAMLAAAPKAEPVSDPYKLDLADIRPKLSEIVDCSRALRHGGPAPEDLDEISSALDRATGLADDLLADVVLADPSISSQPEAPKVEQEPVAYVSRKGFMTGGLVWTKEGRDADLPDETKLYTHPAPASDELLEAIAEECRRGAAGTATQALGALSNVETLVSEYIDKHKGPQS